ncbi:MAG: hypothetical protein H6737_25810 [Alphaproteobacteria bacterium]|nr:hypothetical protein [Alphaproteobacteria bacterium]
MMMLFTAAIAAQQADLPPMAWDWDQPHRLYVETEVTLPDRFWINAEINKNARVIGFQVRSVLACAGTEKEGARKREVRCTFEDIGLVAAGLPGDEGIVQPILDEYDALFASASLDLIVRDDGRITDVNLTDVATRNLRTRQRRESMRLLTRFLAAGIEVPLSRRPGEPLWVSNEALLCTLPTTLGTAGPAEGVHQAAIRGENVEIATNGRGLMAPGESLNQYTCEFAAHTIFDPDLGLVSRTWTMRGEPTPGSPIALGAAGYPYIQRGSARRLAPGETVDVGETREVVPNTSGPSAIQQWNTTPTPMDPSVR